MPEPLWPGDPRQLGAYRLTARLGEGGQGVVYLAESPSGAAVAVKLLQERLTSDPRARSLFERELAAARQVDPFCTARVLDADVHGPIPYIVSEFIPGPSLRDAVRQNGPREGDSLVRLAIGTATALTAIHKAGIVHRDFKPNNVIMGPDGPRVIDFGIARAFEPHTPQIRVSQVVGTPSYMAPEQLRNQPLGPPADMFSWGATIAFAASGRPPFGNDSPAAAINRILNGQPDLRGLSGPLLELVAACLDKDPARRPSARQVLLRLLGHEDLPTATGIAGSIPSGSAAIGTAQSIPTATGVPTAPSPQRTSQSTQRLVLSFAAAIVAVAVLVAVYLVKTSTGTTASPPTTAPTSPTSPTAPPANATWFENHLGLVLPPTWRVVNATRDNSLVGTHVVVPPQSCPDPNIFFGSQCAGFWVMGADLIAHGANGFGSYSGQFPYYPASDVEPCPSPGIGNQGTPSKASSKTVQVGTGHTAAYVEWAIPCTDKDNKMISNFTQREWFLATEQILIIDDVGVDGLPGIITNAVWK